MTSNENEMSATSDVGSEGGSTPVGVPARSFLWGFISQGASSGTNFGLSLVAARELGPTGLGLVFIAFSTYVISLGLQRALITDPLLSTSSAMSGVARTQATRSALSLCILWTFSATVILYLLRFLLDNDVGRGFSLVNPWLIPLLLQDFWRVVLYRDNRASGGAANDLLWLMTMLVLLPLALLVRSSWIVVAWWGLGALTCMVAGFVQTRLTPERPATAIRWWTSAAWPFARWLLPGTMVYATGSQILTFALATVIGSRGLGGLRAGEALFAPLSLLGPALALSGLPALSRQAAGSRDQAKRLAIRLGVIAELLTAPYVVLSLLGSEHLLALVFGGSFEAFGQLVLPLGVGQLLIAPTVGFTLLLLAERRGKALLLIQGLDSIVTLSVGLVLARMFGPVGAAWGMVIGSAVESVTLTFVTLGHDWGTIKWVVIRGVEKTFRTRG